MKTTEVNKELIGRRCECIFTGLMVTGVIEDTQEDKYTAGDLYHDVWAWGRKTDDFGTLHHLKLLPDKADYQTMVIIFGEPISRIDTLFSNDVTAWGVSSLQGWVNSYESTRFTPIDEETAVITSEYNMDCVKEWLQRNVPIKSLKIS